MSARQKLNQAYINGAMIVAGLIAACAESLTVFITLTVILTALAIHAGEIRLSPHPPREQRGPRHQRRGPRDKRLE